MIKWTVLKVQYIYCSIIFINKSNITIRSHYLVQIKHSSLNYGQGVIIAIIFNTEGDITRVDPGRKFISRN